MKRKRKLTTKPQKRIHSERKGYTPSRGVFGGRHFASKRAYENALARRKGFSSRYAQQRAKRPVFTKTDLRRLSATEWDARDRALDALARMRRDGISIEHAARLSDTTVNTVMRHAGTALRKDSHGQWKPTGRDKLYREMVAYTPQGRVNLEITDSATAIRLALYHRAVEHLRDTDSTDLLREFRGKSIKAGKVRYYFLTDEDSLWRIIRAGELSTEGPYASSL